MQTFLPSTSFQQSAKWLDRPGRLGKQRLEAIDCLKLNLHLNYDIPREILNFPERLIKRYGNHPTRLMWSGYEDSLWHYCETIIMEWRNAGYKDCCLQELVRIEQYAVWRESTSPPWLTEEFASNHRSILLGKVYETMESIQDKMLGLRVERMDYSIEETTLTKEINKLHRKFDKAVKNAEWYEQFGWTEQPAQKVKKDGRLVWPYLWGVDHGI